VKLSHAFPLITAAIVLIAAQVAAQDRPDFSGIERSLGEALGGAGLTEVTAQVQSMIADMVLRQVAALIGRQDQDQAIQLLETTRRHCSEGRLSVSLAKLLADRGIEVITSAYCEVHEPGRVTINPGSRQLQADRIVAMPELLGPSVAGIPGGSAGGFIPIDIHCKVPGVERVYAAGDAADFAIKHGGIAAQQADVAAQAIVATAGLGPDPAPFHPVLQAILLTGGKPLYLSAHVTGGHGSSSEVSESPLWSPATKIAARYLGPYLQARDRVTGSTR